MMGYRTTLKEHHEHEGPPVRSDVVAVLRSLEDEGGKLHAEAIVAAARPQYSPLHALFTWDDALAAHERRLEQARGIIRSYKIAVVTTTASGSQRAVLTRQYVSDYTLGLDSPPGTYTNVETLSEQEQELRLLRMRRELGALVRRYEDVPEFWKELGAALAGHEGRRRKRTASQQ